MPEQVNAERKTGTRVDTISFTKEEAESWEIPGFQRDVKVNDKVREVAVQITNDGGVIPGIITFGVLNRQHFLIDGQQRRQAFLLSGCMFGYADVRYYNAESMADMSEEYVRLNRHLVNMKPDDILRGLELSRPAMQAIRKACAFVGYDQVRRNDRSPVVSMSAILRAWAISEPEVPVGSSTSAADLASLLTEEDAEKLIAFLKLAYAAWGRDQEYIKLWGMVNICLCMWLYRRLVLDGHSWKTQKISKEQFGKCLMALSADSQYLDWLVGRHIGDRDRAPGYNRIKSIFASRLKTDTGHKHNLPAPAWSHGGRR